MEKRKGSILLVEDESSLSDLISLNLELEGYEVATTADGMSGLEMARTGDFQLCVLDIMLPKMDGLTVCKTLRSEGNTIPILFLSAKGEGSDRVQGLKFGANDYLTKPFHLEELLLRIENLIRKFDPSTVIDARTGIFQFGGNVINFSTFEVEGNNTNGKITLSKREIDLLQFLIARAGEVVSRDEILTAVWGEDVFPSTRTIDNYILAFRKYFETNSREPEFFHSIRSVGYKFTGSKN